MVERNRNLILRGAVIGLALALATVAWISSGDGSTQVPANERPVSTDQLVEAADGLDQPVYWAGAPGEAQLVLVEFDGGVQVRYRRGEEDSAESLTVGSYRVEDPESTIAEVADRPGTVVRNGAGGREVVVDPERPTSAYFADSDGGVQVEVYDPFPARTMRLALSGRVRPVR